MGKSGKEVIFVDVLIAKGKLLGGDGSAFDGDGKGRGAIFGLNEVLCRASTHFIGEYKVLQIHLKTMWHETHGLGGEKMRLQELLAVCVCDLKAAVDECELTQGIVIAVLLQMKTARGMGERLLLHVALDDGAEVKDACLTTESIKCGGENGRLAAVEINFQKHGTALEV